MADDLAGEDELPKVEWMARELERGRWAKYVLNNHSYRDFGTFQTADTPDEVGSLIRARLKELGVGDAESIKVYGAKGGGPVAAQQSIKKLWNWAEKFELRKFTAEKLKPGGGGPDHQ